MCVKIIKDNLECEYDTGRPFLEQFCGSTQVIVKYKPDDEQIDTFLKEMELCVNSGVNPNLNIKVQYGDSFSGFKTKKEFDKVNTDIKINEVVKLMVLNHLDTDKKLEELSSMCSKREIDVK
jgi:hypothetical protein